MAGVETVELVVAHSERATLRVGGVFLKIDADQGRTDREVAAMGIAPVPTPDVLWRKPPVLALAELSRHGARPPRRAVTGVAGGVGCGGRRRTAAARGAAAAVARSTPGRDRLAPRRRVRTARDDRRPSRR